MHLYLTIKVTNIQLNVNIKIRTNGGVDEDHVQLHYHYVEIRDQLLENLTSILVPFHHQKRLSLKKLYLV